MHKNFHIFYCTLPVTLTGIADRFFFVCCFLTSMTSSDIVIIILVS